MIKKIVILIMILIGLPSFILAQNFKGEGQGEIAILPPAEALKSGEVLAYSVEWLGIPVGSIIFKNEGIVTIRNHNCYHIKAISFPNGFVRKFYDLEYEVHTYIDTESLSTRRFTKTRRMNKKPNNILIDFYPEEKRVVYKSWGEADFFKISDVRDDIIIQPTDEIPGYTQDLLSSFYYLRLLQIKVNQSYPINVYYNQANWSIAMNVEGTLLREIRKRGTFRALKASIVSDLTNFILGKRGFLVYLTVDPRRIPIEFKVDTSLGYLHAIIKAMPE